MRLYVWRAYDGRWVVSYAPRGYLGPSPVVATHSTHRQAFADAWARTHPKEET